MTVIPCDMAWEEGNSWEARRWLWGKALVPLCVRQRESTHTTLFSATLYFRWTEGIPGLLRRVKTSAWDCLISFLISLYPLLWSPWFSLLGAPLPPLALSLTALPAIWQLYQVGALHVWMHPWPTSYRWAKDLLSLWQDVQDGWYRAP